MKGKVMPTVDSKILAASPGIQEWSKDRRPLVIMSAATGSEIDDKHHGALGRVLKQHGFDFGEVDGCYKGQTEKSYLIEYDNEYEFQQIVQLAKFYAQESILAISPERNATLLFMDTHNFEKLGKIEAVSEIAAKKHNAWTRTKNGQYYIVRGEDNA